MLARLGEREPLAERQLVEELQVDSDAIGEALGHLRARSLVGSRDDGAIALTATGRDDYERLVAARCARLGELLAGWRPDQELELRGLIDRLGRDLVSGIPAPPAASGASGA